MQVNIPVFLCFHEEIFRLQISVVDVVLIQKIDDDYYIR